MSLMALLGYCEGKETVLTRPGDVSSAKAALAGAPKLESGRGMDAGRIVVRARNSTVVAAMFTPSNRSWNGPLFEGILEGRPRGVAVLHGRFRWTYPQMVSMAMFQLGIVLFCAEGLLTRGYRDFALNGLAASLVAVLAVLSGVLLPRLAWRTRAWKRRAVIEFLGSCGFVAENRQPEKTSQ